LRDPLKACCDTTGKKEKDDAFCYLFVARFAAGHRARVRIPVVQGGFVHSGAHNENDFKKTLYEVVRSSYRKQDCIIRVLDDDGGGSALKDWRERL
jgi:hypothetical protein